MFKYRHEKKCFKKLQKESVDVIDIDIIPNCPITVETDLSNFEENFDTICANFLGQWCEADLRKKLPNFETKVKENKTSSTLETTESGEISENLTTLEKVKKANDFVLNFT